MAGLCGRARAPARASPWIARARRWPRCVAPKPLRVLEAVAQHAVEADVRAARPARAPAPPAAPPSAAERHQRRRPEVGMRRVVEPPRPARTGQVAEQRQVGQQEQQRERTPAGAELRRSRPARRPAATAPSSRSSARTPPRGGARQRRRHRGRALPLPGAAPAGARAPGAAASATMAPARPTVHELTHLLLLRRVQVVEEIGRGGDDLGAARAHGRGLLVDQLAWRRPGRACHRRTAP